MRQVGSVGITDGRGSILGRGRDFSLFHSVQIESGAHPSSYTMSIETISAGVKLATSPVGEI
jgi:hypothetical protein